MSLQRYRSISRAHNRKRSRNDLICSLSSAKGVVECCTAVIGPCWLLSFVVILMPEYKLGAEDIFVTKNK